VKETPNYYVGGQWNAICDRCGFKFKASVLRLEWDGIYVCDKCFEYRQPQDFVRAVPDVQAPPWTRPDQEPVFVPTGSGCTVYGSSGIAGLAVAGCMVAGRFVQVN
jgi:hypothetical protein